MRLQRKGLFMQTSSDARSLKKSGFFARQWAPNPTTEQIIFDLIVGAIGPVICFLADPIVFRGGMWGSALFPKFQLLTYLISAVEIVLLLIWLTLGTRLKAFSAVIGGALIAGSILSAVIGFAILPYSLIGLMVLIGVAGFTPFLTSFVYLRNGVRALRGQEQNAIYELRFPIAIMAASFAMGVPYAGAAQLNKVFSSAVSNLLNGNEAQVAQAMEVLKPWALLSEIQLEPIVNAIQTGNHDPLRQLQLEKCYREITGREVRTAFND